MKLTVRVLLHPSPGDHAELLRLLLAFNEACNEVADVAVRSNTYSHRNLRSLVYKDLSKSFRYGCSDLVPKKVASVYSNKRRRGKRVCFKQTGSIPLDSRSITYKRTGHVSIGALDGRLLIPFSCRPGATLSNKHEATLSLDEKGRFFLNQVIETEEPVLQPALNHLGVDLGVTNVATDSDGEIYSSKHLNNLRRRQRRLRQKLQAKGTKSARRLLKKQRRKESRFARDLNHKISRKLVDKAFDSGRGLAMEDLQGIRDRIKVRKAQRATLSSWSFGQLRSFVEYKAKRRGVSVVFVNPRNTSRTCPSCHHVDKRNRPSQATFKCVRCGCAGHADVFAAREIASRANGFGQTRYLSSGSRETGSAAVSCEPKESA